MRCTNCAAELAPEDAVCRECGTPRPQLSPRFAEVEQRAALLRARREAGEIDDEQLSAEAQKLMLQDDSGGYWTFSLDGHWYRHDGQAWVADEPPVIAAPAARRLRPISQPFVEPLPGPAVPAVPSAAPVPSMPPEAEAGAAIGPAPRRAFPWKWLGIGCGGLAVLTAALVGALVLARVIPLLPARETAAPALPAESATPALALTPTEIIQAAENEPTLTPTPAAMLEPGAAFSDDFSSADSGWRVADLDIGQLAYGEGYYAIVATVGERPVRSLAGRVVEDVLLEVEAVQVSGPADGSSFGLGCRVQPNGDGYYLLVSGSGEAGIFLATGDTLAPLADWMPAGGIRRGNAPNRLCALCRGGTLVLIVNDEPVAWAYDETYASGDLALEVRTAGSGATEVHFRALRATAPFARYLPVVFVAD
jgi:hypothetical protein